MSQPEKRPKVKLDARVSPELKEKVREYQQANGMKEISEAINDLIERGLRPDLECLNLQTCRYRSRDPRNSESLSTANKEANLQRCIDQQSVNRFRNALLVNSIG